MDHILIANSNEYEGKYVTTCSPDSVSVVSSSESAVEAYETAKQYGCEDPILIYVPSKEEKSLIF